LLKKSEAAGGPYQIKTLSPSPFFFFSIRLGGTGSERFESSFPFPPPPSPRFKICRNRRTNTFRVSLSSFPFSQSLFSISYCNPPPLLLFSFSGRRQLQIRQVELVTSSWLVRREVSPFNFSSSLSRRWKRSRQCCLLSSSFF